MKTNTSSRPHRSRGNRRESARRRSEGGFAVLVIMILLVIMVSLSMGNNVALARLQSDLHLVERRQQLRLSASRPATGAARTNSPSPAAGHATPSSNRPSTP